MRKKIYVIMRRLIAAFVCLNLSLSTVGGMGFPAFAGSSDSVTSAAADHGEPTDRILEFSRVADPDTMDDYVGRLLNETDGSRYAGRVWTDKSVFAYNDGNADANNKSKTYPYKEGGHFDGKNTLSLDMDHDGYNGSVKFYADFLHVFSALASSQVVNEYPPSPVDLVIVFDMSGSMGQDTRYGIDVGLNSYQEHNDNGDSETNKWPAQGVIMSERIKNSRIQKTLDAINKTIDDLMAQNPQNRVAVCGYGANAVVLMPLGHYKKVDDATPYLSVGGMETLYHPSDLVYREPGDKVKKNGQELDAVTQKGWYWMNNRDTCYTVVVNAKYNTYTGILNDNGDGKDQDGANDGTDKWTKISKTVSNNVLNKDGESVHAFPGNWDDQGNPTDTYKEKSIKVYEGSSSDSDAWSGGKFEAVMGDGSNLSLAMANTSALTAKDYVGYFTNTQGGIYLAYKQLADSTATTYTEPLSNGVMSTVARIPAAIIMSDGGANFSFNEMGPEKGEYTAKDWYARYGQELAGGLAYATDDCWGSGIKNWNEDFVEGRELDYKHRLGTDQWHTGNLGDEWYKVYLPGEETLGSGWNGLHGIYNSGADFYKDGTLSFPPHWDNPGVFYSSDNSPVDAPGTVLEVLLTASYMSEVVQEHYSAGWSLDNATMGSQTALSTYTMNVDTVHVPQWGKMRLYPTLDPKEYPLDTIESAKWYNNPEKFGEEELADDHKLSKVFEDLYTSWTQWKNEKTTEATIAAVNNTKVTIKSIESAGEKAADYKTSITTKDGKTQQDNVHITDKDVIANIAYNDGFYDVTSTQLGETFGEILNLVLGNVFVPVSGDNDAGVGDSITYQDPIGKYMEIKNASVETTPHHTGNYDDVFTNDTEQVYDMSILLFGEMHGLVRTGVYDYKWNDKYMSSHSLKTGEEPFPMGWYKGDDPASEDLKAIPLTEKDKLLFDENGSYPAECESAQDAWKKGWVLRFNYKTLLSYVPIAEAPDDDLPKDLSPQIKNTVYTVYRFACSKTDRNKLRRNPVYGEVPTDLVEKWDEEFRRLGGNYPEDNSIYSTKEYPGVYRLSDIRVWLEDTGNFVDEVGAITPEGGYDRSLYLNIPAVAVPTELATITLGKDGVLSYKTNLGTDHKIGSYDTVVSKDDSGIEVEERYVNEEIHNSYCYQSTPLRLFYTVGLEEDLIVRDDAGKQIGVNIAALPEEYVSTHSIVERSTIYFISNYYSDTKYEDYVAGESTRGDPTVTFSPSTDNRYYVFQKPLPLYAHAYRVKNGELVPVDRSNGGTWEGNLGGNGKTLWEDGKTGGGSWSGGVYIGTYASKEAFAQAYQEAKDSPKKKIEDANGILYDLGKDETGVQNGEGQIVFLTGDVLDHVTSLNDEQYAEGSKSFSSDDYFFILLEYYAPDKAKEGVGDKNQPLKGTYAGSAIQYAVARRGSDFGSGFASKEINNGDMLCWTETGGKLNVNNNRGFEYLSRAETGDNTRGEPTFEKLTYEENALRTYLETCGIKDEDGEDGKKVLTEQVEYWKSMQQDPQVQAALEEACKEEGKDKLTKTGFKAYFQFAVSARPGGIRAGNMANNRQQKKPNPTETSKTYYVPTVSDTSATDEGIVLNSYLGNNGRLEVGNSRLLITKTLHIPEGYNYAPSSNESEIFNYQVYIAGATGSMEATMVNYNPVSNIWQRRIGYIDVLVDNNGMLLTSDNKPALFVYEGNTAKQVIAVEEDGDEKYYYVNANGSRGEEYNKDKNKENVYYYLYLNPNLKPNVGENDKLTRRIYQDADYSESDMIVGFTNSFAMYYDGDSDLTQKVNGPEYVKSSVYPAGTFEYCVNSAELIPTSEVDGIENWEYNEHHNGSHMVSKVPIVTVKPNADDNAQEIFSLFGTQTMYMKNTLEFGKNANKDGEDKTPAGQALTATDLYDQFNPSYDRYDLFGGDSLDKIAKSTAEFTLKQNEGIILTGLENRITYRITEKLTQAQIDKGYTLEQISHVQQTGSDSIYKPGVQMVPIFTKDAGEPGKERIVTYEGDDGATCTPEPFHHTNATMWEYYATFATGKLDSHHYPSQSDEILQNPACTAEKSCDVATDDDNIRHYMYREGKLVDFHYQGEPKSFYDPSVTNSRISRYLVSPTVHFGTATDIGYDKYDSSNPEAAIKNYVSSEEYTGVYSVFGNTGYFEEQANYTNTLKTSEFKLTKKLERGDVGDITDEELAKDTHEFTFEISFKTKDPKKDIDGDLKYEIYAPGSEKPIQSGLLLKADGAAVPDKASATPVLTVSAAASSFLASIANRFGIETIGKAAELLSSEDGKVNISATKETDGEGRICRIYWTVKLKKDQYIKVSNLPYEDYDYTVKEIGLDGTFYDVKDGVNNPLIGTAVPGMSDKDEPIAVEFTNVKQAGKLTVIKKLSPETLIIPSDKDILFKFELILTQSDGKTPLTGSYKYKIFNIGEDESSDLSEFTPTDGKYSFELKADQQFTVILPIDTKYTVTENGIGEDGLGYWTPNVSGGSGDGATAAGTITVDEDGKAEYTVTFDNIKPEPKEAEASVIITKKVTNVNETYKGIEKDDFTFKVTPTANPENGAVNVSNPEHPVAVTEYKVTINASSNSENADEYTAVTDNILKDIRFVKAGTYKFTVTEYNDGKHPEMTYDESSYEITVEVAETVEGGILKLNAVVNIVKTGVEGTAESVVFTNPMRSGELSITKTIDGAIDTTAEFEFEVTLKDSEDKLLTDTYNYTVSGDSGKYQIAEGNGTIKLKAGQTATITGLPIGTKYTVTEKDIENDHYVFKSANGKADKTARGEIGAEDGANKVTVSYVNEYVGSITVSKKLADGISDAKTEFKFKLTLTPPPEGATLDNVKLNGEPLNGTDGIYTFGLFAGSSATFTGIPIGTKYQLEETASGEKYKLESASVNGTEVKGEIKGTVEKEHADVSIEVTNDYKTGEITVTKALADGISDAKTEFEFTLELKLPAGGKIRDITASEIFENPDINEVNNTVTYTFTLKADGSSITFTGIPVGTTYTLTETESPDDGYVFKGATVTVGGNTESKNADGITGTVSAKSSNIAIAVTNKPCVPTKVSLAGTKKVTGADFKLGEKFNFRIARISDSGPDPDPNVVSENEDGSIQFFKDLEFTKPGTYTYTIAEEPSSIDGVGHDNTVYTVTIVVTENEDGTLKAATTKTVPDPESGVDKTKTVDLIEFENPYKVGSLTVTKIIDDAANPLDKNDKNRLTFSFRLTLENSNVKSFAPQSENTTLKKAGDYWTFTLKGGESITITNLPVGTECTVEETDPCGFTVKYDPTNGKKTISEDPEVVTINVTNTKPSSDSITLTLTGTKIFEYDDEEGTEIALKGEEFEFTLTAKDGAPMPKDAEGTTKTVKNLAGGSFSFGTIEFDKAGDYKYTVSEVNKTADGSIDYAEDKEIIVKVVEKVTGDGVANKLEIKSVTVDGESVTVNDDTVSPSENILKLEFTNIYKTGKLTVTKKLADGVANTDKGFEFKLTLTPPPVDGVNLNKVTLSGSSTKTEPDEATGAVTYTFTLKADGSSVTLTGIPVGTTYTLTETESPEDGYVFKGATVTVGENTESKNADGITGTVDAESGDIKIVVTNRDIPEPKKTETHINNGDAEKLADNVYGDVEVGDTITYEISWENYTAGKANVVVKDKLDPDVEFVSASVNGATLNKGGQLVDNANYAINYNGGIVTWTIKNAESGASGTVELKVKVLESAVKKDSVDNTASVKVGNESKQDTNPVENKIGKGDLKIEKKIADSEKLDSAILGTEFTFTVTFDDKNGNALTGDYVIKSGANGENEGTISGGGRFTLKAGESVTIFGLPAGATYRISETPNDRFVKLDDKCGTITAGGVSENTVTFTNRWIKSVTAVIEGTKVFKYDDGAEITLKGGEFTFVIENVTKGEEGSIVKAPMPNPEFTENKAGGPFAFGEITYEKAGTYFYKISEQSVESTDISYSNETYYAKVTVTENNAELSAKVEYFKDDKFEEYIDVDEVVFTNTKKRSPAALTLGGTKKLAYTDGGEISEVPANEFEFILTAEGNAPMPEGKFGGTATVTNIVGGSFSFGKITYEEAGTYIYTVSEVDGGKEGYTYDHSVYTVTVTVSADSETGGLTATKTISFSAGTAAADIVFTNKKERPSTELTIEGLKKLDGAPSGMEFRFGIRPAPESPADIPMPTETTVKNGSDGKFYFGPIKYIAAGEYVYEIYEIPNPDDGKYIYDTTVYRITVKVTQEGGGLTAEYGEPEEVKTTASIVYYATVINGMAIPAATPSMDGGIVFNNKTVTPTGSLNIAKVVKNADGNTVPDGSDTTLFDFTVKLEAPEGTTLPATYVPEAGEDYMIFHLTAGQSMSFKDLPVGTKYYINEVGQKDYTCENPKVNGVITEEGVTVEVKIVNIQPEPEVVYGSLTLTKTVVGEDNGLPFTFTIWLSKDGAPLEGEYPYTGTVSGTISDGGTIKLGNGGSVTIINLPVGTTYTITESASDYTASAEVDGASVEVSNGTVSGGITAAGTAVHYTNSKTPPPPPVSETSSLTLTKTVVGEDNGLPFTFTIWLSKDGAPLEDEYPYTGTVSGTISDGGTIKLGNGGSVTITNLPVGTTYTITESVSDYTVTADVDGIEVPVINGTVSGGITAVVTTVHYTNSKTPPPPPVSETGNLTVAKTVQSPDPSDYMRPFGFVVQLSDPTINGIYGDMMFTNGTAYITLMSGQSLTAAGLPAGISYSVYETNAYGFTVFVNGMPSAGSASGMILSGSVRFEAFTNISDIPEPEYGGLTVTKTVEGSGADYEKYFTFTVTLGEPLTGQYGQMYFNYGTATFTLKHGESYTASGIPAGTSYSVTESDNEGYDVTSVGEVGTVIANTVASADFVNIREEPEGEKGGLTVRKTVTGRDGDQSKEFTFTVTLGDSSINGTYGGMTFVNGTATFTLRHSESVTALGLPADISYTVTETDNEGYTVASLGETGTIPANGEAVAEFVNSRGESDEFGDLTVAKFVTGFGIDYQNFTFTVTLSAPITGQYGQMFFNNGVAVFTLKHGETATATGLPAGVSYTVTESNNDYYIVSSTGERGIIVKNGSAYCEYINYLTEEDYPKVPTVDFNPPTGNDYIAHLGAAGLFIIIAAIGIVVKRRKER